METFENCIICGESSFNETINKKQAKIFSSWKRKCSKSLSDVLLGSDCDPLLHYFNTGSYCYLCQKTTREINFTRSLLSTLQNKITVLSRCIRRRLYGNYQRFGEKSVDNEIDRRLQKLRHENHSFEAFSYNEVVEILYIAVSRFSGELNFPQEDIKGDIKSFENSAMNSIKIEPFHDDVDENDDFENPYGNSIGSPSDKGVPSVKIKTDTQTPSEFGSSSSNHSIRSSKRKAALRIKMAIRSDSGVEEGKKGKGLKGKKKADHIPHDELAEKKLREKYDRKNRKRREQRGMDPNHYKRIKCTYENCTVSFMTEEKKQFHIRQIHLGEEKPFKCPKCPKSFKINKCLVEHKRIIHCKERDYDHVCKFCGKGYKVEEELTTHYAGAHQGPNPFACAFCDTICTNAGELHKHVSDLHPNYQKPQCDICCKFFPTEKALKNHKVIHNDPELQYKCELCDRIFATTHRLKRHQEVHNEENSVVCEYCGKAFKNKMALRCHSEFHTNEKRFHCKVCGKGFVKPGCCRKHEVTHSGVRQFMCKVCGRVFSFKYNLADHEKIHEREKDPTVVVRKRNSQKIAVPSNNIPITSHHSFSVGVPPKNIGPWEPKPVEGYFM